METVYILFSCEVGYENDLVSLLSQLDEIKEVMITYGDYDIIVKAETQNSTDMDNLITTKIRKFEKIRSTITLRVAN
jgi:DNA-binding Lrp family transcriptional regulator